ncbi:hypothetical protein [Rhodovulum adriaticum]|uniref:AAA+ family ATPase n=1 Tax=Rhodovulum adriaticum TaxID=35804 RepID=A0A4R2NY63_RHOAD|nr:hypothetical protein [Rhodovulum adriaticum]MBK1635240.1 hypothetical protein [Rhodovulum adriaticum]TCP26375.1 hypothetical protein EV656_102340 [Rhodovulum adriaticum]
MKRIAALTLAALVTLSPAAAQEAEEPGDLREGMDLLNEGMRLFLRGLGDELEPRMRALVEEMEPAMTRLMELIDDIDAYHLPEKLPNGDIIIRRKQQGEGGDLPPVGPDGEVEL